MQQGLFITLEGIDGVGKSTQASILEEYLRNQGHSVLHTFEPGGTAVGSRIRAMLLDPDHGELHSMTEILLYAADRAQHVNEIMLPALKKGKIVLCERFIDSSVAYQGYGLGMEIEAIKAINYWASGGVKPDVTVYLDGDPREFLSKTKGDRIERRTLDYYARVRNGFLSIAAEEPERVKVVSAEGTRECVAQRVLETLRGRCGL